MSRARPIRRIVSNLPALPFVLTGLWSAGRLLGDGTWWSGLLFYIPTPVPITACVAGAVLLWKSTLRKAGIAGLVAVLLTIHWASTEVNWVRPTSQKLPGTSQKLPGTSQKLPGTSQKLPGTSQKLPGTSQKLPGTNDSKPQELRLVHWNVFRNFLPWQHKIERLRRLEGDIYVLNEVPRQVTRGNWALKLGPGMDYAMGQLMVVACRGKVLSHELEVDPGLITLWVQCALAPADAPGTDLDETVAATLHRETEPRALSILAVDMSANPFMARDPVLARLVAKIEDRRPDLIAGDFNAPRRSRRLQQLPNGYRHAYETTGRGWPYTWPVPFPLLAIDQCIFGPRIEPHGFRYLSTASSDHRVQVFEFETRH